MTAYDPQFFAKKLLYIRRDVCKKQQLQNIDIWPNDGHFMTMTNLFRQDFQNYYQLFNDFILIFHILNLITFQ